MKRSRLLRKQAISEVEKIIQSPTTIQQNVIQNNFQNLANEGRQVLKFIDDYKFKMIQSLNMLKDQKLKNRLEQKQKLLMSASSLIYSIVFDLENQNITPDTYEEEQLNIANIPTNEENVSEDNISEEDTNELEETDKSEEPKESEENTNMEENDSNEEENDELKMQGNFDEIFDDFDNEEGEIEEEKPSKKEKRNTKKR